MMPQLDRNLNALAICYRILGGLVGLVLSLVILTLGTATLTNGSIPLLEIAFLLLLLVAGGAMTFVLFEVAGSLRDHERRTFCLVVAWLICAFFPLGTVLGVLTILQLIQPDAERAFREAEQLSVKAEDFRNPEGSPATN
jgi:hypothetical protein